MLPDLADLILVQEIEGQESASTRASDADRDKTIDLLNNALAIGQLTPEEHSDRVQSALTSKTMSELGQLTADLSLPIAPARSAHRRALPAIALALAIGLVSVILLAHHGSSRPQSHSAAHSSPVPSTVPSISSQASAVVASPVSQAVNGLEIQVVPPGAFSSHDPADECGNFGLSYQGGGNNCYVVVRFINSGGSSVTFTPADLRMVDQTGDEYMVGPVSPSCYDTIDVNAPQTLQPGQSLDVQWCTAVMTGALPQIMKGSRSLAGLNLSVPSDSIDGTWGGA